MLNNISEKVSQLDGEAIQNYRFRVKLLFIFSLLCYIILAVITVTNNHKFIMVILTLIILAIFIGYSFVDNAITKGTNMILTDKCFPDKYLKALEQTSPYTQGNMGSTHSALKNIHHLNKSYALIVEGEFDEGLELLKELEPERFNEFQKKTTFLHTLLFKFLSYCFSRLFLQY